MPALNPPRNRGKSIAWHRYFRFFLSLFFSTPQNAFFPDLGVPFTGFDRWLCYFRYGMDMAVDNHRWLPFASDLLLRLC
jgi:hypothetical protein